MTMSDETDNWEWEKTFTYTITSKDVRVQQWEVQSCGKQLTESEVKRIAEKEGYVLWGMLEGRYGHVRRSTIPYDDTVEITFQRKQDYHLNDEEEIEIEVDGWFKEEEE
jgi:hypothetical protein